MAAGSRGSLGEAQSTGVSSPGLGQLRDPKLNVQPLGEGAAWPPDATICLSLQQSSPDGGVCAGLRELGILDLEVVLPSCGSLQAEVEAYPWDTRSPDC